MFFNFIVLICKEVFIESCVLRFGALADIVYSLNTTCHEGQTANGSQLHTILHSALY